MYFHVPATCWLFIIYVCLNMYTYLLAAVHIILQVSLIFCFFLGVFKQYQQLCAMYPIQIVRCSGMNTSVHFYHYNK